MDLEGEGQRKRERDGKNQADSKVGLEPMAGLDLATLSSDLSQNQESST